MGRVTGEGSPLQAVAVPVSCCAAVAASSSSGARVKDRHPLRVTHCRSSPLPRLQLQLRRQHSHHPSLPPSLCRPVPAACCPWRCSPWSFSAHWLTPPFPPPASSSSSSPLLRCCLSARPSPCLRLPLTAALLFSPSGALLACPLCLVLAPAQTRRALGRTRAAYTRTSTRAAGLSARQPSVAASSEWPDLGCRECREADCISPACGASIHRESAHARLQPHLLRLTIAA